MSIKSCSNILKMSILALIAAMAGTEVQIVNHLEQHKAKNQSLPKLIVESRNCYKMIECMVNVSRQDNVPELPDEEQDPQWHQIWPQYLLDKARDGPGDKANIQKPTLLTSKLFGLGMGPEFSSDIAGDGPRKRKSNEDEYDPELERIQKRKT